MGIRERLSGNEAVAYAMKQINPDVMGAYPITPSTEIPQYFSTYVDNGEVDTVPRLPAAVPFPLPPPAACAT